MTDNRKRELVCLFLMLAACVTASTFGIIQLNNYWEPSTKVLRCNATQEDYWVRVSCPAPFGQLKMGQYPGHYRTPDRVSIGYCLHAKDGGWHSARHYHYIVKPGQKPCVVYTHTAYSGIVFGVMLGIIGSLLSLCCIIGQLRRPLPDTSIEPLLVYVSV